MYCNFLYFLVFFSSKVLDIVKALLWNFKWCVNRFYGCKYYVVYIGLV